VILFAVILYRGTSARVKSEVATIIVKMFCYFDLLFVRFRVNFVAFGRLASDGVQYRVI
jgi:hypothetical protein